MIFTHEKVYKYKKDNYYAEYNIPGIRKSQLNQLLISNELEHLGGILGVINSKHLNQIAILDKTKPHLYYDLMVYDMDIDRHKIMNKENSKLEDIMNFAYTFICFVKKEDIIKKFGLKKNFFKVIYNYSDFVNENTAMSLENFHVHLNNISNLDLNRIQKKKLLMSNLDPSTEILSYLLMIELNKHQYNFINKMYCSGFQKMIIDNTPYGLIIETNFEWTEIKSNKFIMFLKKINDKMRMLKNKFENHSLIKDFNNSNGHKILIENYITMLKRSNYKVIKGVNYSVTLYNNNNNNISILVQPKQFSKIGGAGETFVLEKYSLLKINRGKTYFTNKELLMRREFQRELLNYNTYNL